MMLTRFSPIKYGLIALLTTATLIGLTTTSNAEALVGLTSTSVFTFDSATPNSVTTNLALNGFDFDSERAVSIDRRPVGGTPLTVLTVGQRDDIDTTTVGRLYDLDPTTGLLSNSRLLLAGLDPLSPLAFSTSVNYTIDFNPTGPVALRIVGSNNTNYRVTDPLTGNSTVDTALSGTGIPAVGIAYSNNDNNPGTGTTLYNIDRNNDRLSIVTNPNAGTTAFLGALGIDLKTTNGLQEIDISGTGIAYGVFQLQAETNISRLYTINLATGAATSTNGANNNIRFGNTNLVVRGIAAMPSVAVPENNTMALLAAGLTLGGVLVRRRKISK